MDKADSRNSGLRTAQQAWSMRVVTWCAVFVTLVIITTKIWAWWLTGGAAMLGSLTDSLLDVVVSVINLVAVRQSLVPPDKDHRFGHEKAEAIAGILQTTIIGGSALFLTVESIRHIIDPQPLERAGIGIAVSGLAIVLTLALVWGQNIVIRRTGSVAISADQLHFKGDIGLNAGVILSFLLAGFGGWVFLDGIFGLGVAAYVLMSAITIFRRSLDILMDRELHDDDRRKILDLAQSHPRVVGVHEMRTRTSGSRVFIQLHLDLDAQLSLKEAHEIADAVETRMLREFPGAEILIHKDPVTVAVDEPPRVLH